MYENNICSIIIVKNKDRNNDVNKPVGIITERDIVRTLGLQQPALLKVPVYQLMTKPLITISPNSPSKMPYRLCN
jgi:CBS domain-containing protein